MLGSDIAGTVESVGADVTRFSPGDEVFGDLFASGFGAFAEYARVPESALTAKPAGLTFEQAATLPQAGLLALQGLRHGRPVEPGDSVLINGAGGGAGTFAVQIAKSMGAHVTGVDSAGKLDLLRALGADEVIDYAGQDFTRTGRRYDRIIDFVSRRSPADYRRAMAEDGKTPDRRGLHAAPGTGGDRGRGPLAQFGPGGGPAVLACHGRGGPRAPHRPRAGRDGDPGHREDLSA